MPRPDLSKYTDRDLLEFQYLQSSRSETHLNTIKVIVGIWFALTIVGAVIFAIAVYK